MLLFENTALSPSIIPETASLKFFISGALTSGSFAGELREIRIKKLADILCVVLIRREVQAGFTESRPNYPFVQLLAQRTLARKPSAMANRQGPKLSFTPFAESTLPNQGSISRGCRP